MIAEQLKKSILQAAIQGKLTKQLPEDGNAQDLLEEIQKEKAHLIKDGKIRKDKPVPEITDDELPFDIPENWCWTRLGDIGVWSAGTTPSRSNPKYYQNGTIPWLKTGDLNDGLIEYVPEYITDIALKETSLKLQPKGTVLIAMYGATIGKVGLLNIESTTNQACCGCNVFNGVYNLYLFYFLMSHKQEFTNQSFGGAQPNISREKIVVELMPLPPLAEQKRIVKRLEELLPETDVLKTDECKLEVLQRAFPKKMRDSVLQYAVMGKLTEQLPSDGDAHDLLKDIQREKDRLFKDSRIKNLKPLPEIADDDLPFGIPENWCWVRLGSISFDHGQKRPDTDFTYIDISSINNDANILGNLNNIIKPNEAPSRARKIVFKGDVIYATVRPYLHNICLIDREIIPKPIVSTGFAVVCTPKPLLNNYLFYCFLSPMFDSYANDNDNSKGVAYPAINDDKFSKALIPLPPLEEQRRIVHRLEELLPEIGKLGTKTLTVG